ncbi:MAG: hypothetical protein QXD62_03900 [Candidatus Woesearchaeota archaeon]
MANKREKRNKNIDDILDLSNTEKNFLKDIVMSVKVLTHVLQKAISEKNQSYLERIAAVRVDKESYDSFIKQLNNQLLEVMQKGESFYENLINIAKDSGYYKNLAKDLNEFRYALMEQGFYHDDVMKLLGIYLSHTLAVKTKENYLKELIDSYSDLEPYD